MGRVAKKSWKGLQAVTFRIMMDSRYYSKKLNRHFTKRLDFLIYAHDGRGLGHASRSIAIGLALRRLYPQCKTLFVSGCKQASALIGNGTLDWIKLPSYATTIVKGRAEGGYGHSNFYKSVLGQLRTEMLASIMKIFQPRIVLVDHAPTGKRNELVRALEVGRDVDSRWVLGLRGIIGDDKDVWSEESIQCFKNYYDLILWYGDTQVMGSEYPNTIAQRFGVKPVETGYVSRLMESKYLLASEKDTLAGTISIPWGTEKTWKFARRIRDAIKGLGESYGPWRLFVEQEKKEMIQDLFRDLPFCTVDEVSERYTPSLVKSKMAIVYAGYNSISDILASRIPAVVLLRDLKDREQQTHVDSLLPFTKEYVTVLTESNTDTKALQQAMERQLKAPPWLDETLNLNGAEVSALTVAEGIVCEE
jgi:predicted glycosyltransferase